MTVRYRCWGLVLESDFECPWLPTTEEQPSLCLRLGKTPDVLEAPVVSALRFQARPGEFLLWIDDLARFYVKGGTEIVVELWGELAEIHVFLLGSAMAALLYQRGLVPLHGSVVAFGEQAYGFLGPSGIGKSTLAAALCQRGGRLLGDDICALQPGREGVYVLPGYPKQNLWPDSLRRLGDHEDEVPRLRPCLDKRVRAVTHFEGEAQPLAGVFALEVWDGSEVRRQELAGHERFLMFERQLYRPRFAQGLLGPAGLFTVLAPLVPRVPLSRLQRPRHGFLLDQLCDRVVDSIQNPSLGERQ